MTGAGGDRALWAAFTAVLPVDGASISVMARDGTGSTVSTSDPVAAHLDALQVQLGEGPRWRAFRLGVPVLVPDVGAAGAHAGWPLFGIAVDATAARAVFSFPLVLGRLIVGAADLYGRTAQQPWSDDLVQQGTALAAAAALPSVRLAEGSAATDRSTAPAGAAELRREVRQATGVLIVRLDVGPAEALARLEARAFAGGRPVLDVARDVLAGRLDFRDEER